MIPTYILIILIGRYSSLTTVTAEFNSPQTCEAARTHIVNNYNRNELHSIVSQGCYKK